MPFVPIALVDYLSKVGSRNPGFDRVDAEKRLRAALADFNAGVRCQCGATIWVIGSAEVGNACFSCITGEASAGSDYELAEACFHCATRKA